MSVAPVPFATFANTEFSSIGKNYIKCLFALGLQGFLMFFIIILYQAMVTNAFSKIALENLTDAGDALSTGAVTKIAEASGLFWTFLGSMLMITVYSVVLLMMMFKTSAISKSIMTAN